MEMTMLIKPASGHCNLKCKYCFYCNIVEKRKNNNLEYMSKRVVDAIVKKALQVPNIKKYNFLFQGGEPTLVGIDYYKYFIEKFNLENKNSIASYSIQTNGTLIDDKWGEFFKENNFLVGISLDGPCEINDKNRVDYCNNGSFDRVLTGINYLKKHNVDFNVLTVINNENVKNGKEIYKFFKEQNFRYLQFIECLDLNSIENKKLNFLNEEYLGEFLCDIFELYYKDYFNDNYIGIRFFENILTKIIYNINESCDGKGYCTIQNVIEADGSIYPCDFYTDDEYKLGNILENDFSEIILNEKAKKFVENSNNSNENCKKCEFYFLCRGGCKKNKINGENKYCKSYKIFYKRKINEILEIAKDIRNKQTGS